jgi:23S rRNA pseudouridine1911/1915/1917 synthase
LQAVVPDGRDAATDYVVEERFVEPEPTSLLTVRLETGRTHQIRVHLAAIDHPVVADKPYGSRFDLGLSRPFLHSARLSLDHPITGAPIAFESPLPEDLQAALDRLG